MQHKERYLELDHPAVRLATAEHPLEINVRLHGPCAVVRLSGSAGIGQVGPLRDALDELAARDIRLVVLDLHELDFIGSEGLAALVSGYLQMGGRRYRQDLIRLAAPQPAVLDVIWLARLTELFPVYDSVEEAMTQRA